MDNKELYLSIKNDLDNYINDNYVFEKTILNVAKTRKELFQSVLFQKERLNLGFQNQRSMKERH